MGTPFDKPVCVVFCLAWCNLSCTLPFLWVLENLDTSVCRLHPFFFFGNLLPHGLVRFHRPLWCASKLLLTTTWGVQNDNWIQGVCTQFFLHVLLFSPNSGWDAWWNTKLWSVLFACYSTELFPNCRNGGGGHTWYLSFFLHEQNFWRIKFTPKKRVNYDKIHRKLPIFCVITAKYTVNCQFFALNL